MITGHPNVTNDITNIIKIYSCIFYFSKNFLKTNLLKVPISGISRLNVVSYFIILKIKS